MSNLSNILETFTEDIEALKEVKKAKSTAQKDYSKLETELNKKLEELKKLDKNNIPENLKNQAEEDLKELESKQNDFRLKNNEYADAVYKMQNDFEEIYSTVLNSLVTTVYDARKIMHYLSSKENDSDYANDNVAVQNYLKKYTEVQTFNSSTIDDLIKEAGKLNNYFDTNERKKLMSAFSRHEEEDLNNLKTFIEKKDELSKIINGINLSETAEKLPATDQIITDYQYLIPQIWDKEGKEELSMTDALNVAFSALSKEHDAKAEAEFKEDFELPIIIPLYADPIIVVSFDFKFEFEFKASATATASIKGTISTLSLEATCSLSFGVSIALSLRIIQLIKASINAGIKFEASVTASAKMKYQVASFSGEGGLNAETKLIAKTWISLSICGPVSVIIKAATGKDPELRWSLGQLVLFKLGMEKKAEFILEPLKGKKDGFKAEANFSPLKKGFTVEFVGKEEIKRKLNEKYNNKLTVIKQQFLSNKEMMEAHEDKANLLKKFDVLDFNMGSEDNNKFKKKVQNRTNFMMSYESYFQNFMGDIVEKVHFESGSEELQTTSAFVNSYVTELKKEYHALFIKVNKPEKEVKIEDFFNDSNELKEAKENIWLEGRSSLTRVLPERAPDLIKKLEKALKRVGANQEYVTKLFAFEIIDLAYIDQHEVIDFEKMAGLIDTSKEGAEAFVEELVISEKGGDLCVFGFSSTEIRYAHRRKQRDEAIAELLSKIEGFIKEEDVKDIILELNNPIQAIKDKLRKAAEELKEEFENRKIKEVDNAYHEYLEGKGEQVSIYFEEISGDLGLKSLKDSKDLDPIKDKLKDGIKLLSTFHEANKKKNDYFSSFPPLSKKEIMEIYKGGTDFKKLVKGKIEAKYENQIKILNDWDVTYDLYDWFDKDNDQKKLNNLMLNVIELDKFIAGHKKAKLKTNLFSSKKNYEHYLEKTPKAMMDELDSVS